MKRSTFFAVILLLATSFGMKAQTYDLLSLPSSEFQSGGNAQWSFERYTYATGLYSPLKLYGDSGRINFRDIYNPERYQGVLIGQPESSTVTTWYSPRLNSLYDNKNDYLYVGSNYEVYSLLVANPAIVFTVPTDGYYKVNTTVLREDGITPIPLKAQFRYRYNGEAAVVNNSTIGFDFSYGIGTANTDTTLNDETGKDLKFSKLQPESQTFYIKATAGSKITFEVNCQDYSSIAATTVRNAWARTKWQALNLTVVSSAEATAAAKYCDPYSTGYSEVFWAKFGEASDLLNNAIVGFGIGQYHQTAVNGLETSISTSEAAFTAGNINALNLTHYTDLLDKAMATFLSQVNKFDWTQSYNYKLFPVDESDPTAIQKNKDIISLAVASQWGFKRYTVSTGAYANFTTYGKGGKFTATNAWYNSAGDWLYISENGSVHPTTAISPAITYTAPVDGIYLVGATIARGSSTRPKSMWARFRYIPVGATTAAKASFIMAKEYGLPANSTKPETVDYYIKLKTGDVITFEEDAYTANENSSAGSQWSRIWVATMQGTDTEVEAKITSDTLTYVNPYKPGDFTSLKTLITTCNDFVTAAPIDSVIGKYPLATKTTFQTAIAHSQTMVDVAEAGQPFVNTEVITLTDAFTAFKNAMVVQINGLNDGLYYIKISDGAGGYKYLTDWKLIVPSTSTAVDSIFPIFLSKDDLRFKRQQWKFTKDGSVSRFRIDSKARLDSTLFTNTYVNEGAKFAFNSYSSAWNSFNLFTDGISYAIQRAGSSGSTYFYPGAFTYLSTTGTRILSDGTGAKVDYMKFYLEPVQIPATVSEKSKLDSVIIVAKAVLNSTIEGVEKGNYTTADRLTFNTAISAAITIYTGVNTSGNDITAAIGNLNTAILNYKNAIIKSTNAISNNGYYFIKVDDGAGGYLYLTDNNQVMPVAGGSEVFPVFVAKDNSNIDQQLFRLSIDSTVSRVKIESKIRLGNAIMTTSYIGEDGKFGYNVYNSSWNSFNVYGNGTKYSVQRAGSAGSAFWIPSSFTAPDSSTGTRIRGTGVGSVSDFFNCYLELSFVSGVSKVANANILIYGVQNGIKVLNANSKDAIEVYNLMGSLVKKTSVNSTEEFISIPSGLYIIRVSNGKQQNVNKIFVK